MALAMVYPDPEKGGRGQNSNLKLQFSRQRLSLARTVLHYSKKLAEAGTAQLLETHSCFRSTAGLP